MNALETLKEHNISFEKETGLSLGEKLGAGVDGQVFSCLNAENTVIKISKIAGICSDVSQKYNSIDYIINYIDERRYKYPHLVSVFRPITTLLMQYCSLEWQCKRDYHLSTFHIFYMWMEKLNQISDDETKIFHTLLSHEDANKIKNYSEKEAHNILLEMKKYLSFDLEKAIFFYNAIQKSDIIHNDLHPRNIMKDSSGRFKLIDLDRLSFRNK
jgi:serine/threonine protein kinase